MSNNIVEGTNHQIKLHHKLKILCNRMFSLMNGGDLGGRGPSW